MTTIPHEDLARLRAIAEEGRRAPLLGGWHFILWGVTLSVAMLFNWAVDMRLVPLPPYSLAFSWFGLIFLAWLASSLIARAKTAERGAFAIGNRVECVVWTWAGAMLTVLAVALLVRALVLGGASGWALFAIMPPVSFGAYAVAIGVTAAVAQDRGASAFAFLSLAFAAATALLIGRPEQLPVAAAGVVLVSIPSGLRQLASARRAA